MGRSRDSASKDKLTSSRTDWLRSARASRFYRVCDTNEKLQRGRGICKKNNVRGTASRKFMLGIMRAAMSGAIKVRGSNSPAFIYLVWRRKKGGAERRGTETTRSAEASHVKDSTPRCRPPGCRNSNSIVPFSPDTVTTYNVELTWELYRTVQKC